MSAEDIARYQAAVHAMQTGVALSMPSEETEPKHLRVGINAAMSDHGGLVALLVEKGIISWEEYVKAIADAMERERDSYADRFPPNVHLG